jgi:hypothetical protein
MLPSPSVAPLNNGTCDMSVCVLVVVPLNSLVVLFSGLLSDLFHSLVFRAKGSYNSSKNAPYIGYCVSLYWFSRFVFLPFFGVLWVCLWVAILLSNNFAIQCFFNGENPIIATKVNSLIQSILISLVV